MALRRLVPQQQQSVSSTTASVSSGAPQGMLHSVPNGQFEDHWIADDVPTSGRCSPDVPSFLQGSQSQLSPISGPSAAWERCAAAAAADGADIQRLMLENATLREAFSDANRRLSELEEEKQRFFDEGIFDLVNSVCGQSGVKGAVKPTLIDLSAGDYALAAGSCRQGEGAEQVRPLTVAALDQAGAPAHLPPHSAALALPAGLDLSPGFVAAAELRRRQEETRSAELRLQNEALRRELTRHSEVGEALEEQQQIAEDRMHELEQEQQWLLERISSLSAVGASPSFSKAYRAASSTPSFCLNERMCLEGSPLSVQRSAERPRSRSAGIGEEGDAARKDLEEANRKLRVELEEAQHRHDQLLLAAEEAEEASGAPPALTPQDSARAEEELEAAKAAAAEAAAQAEAATAALQADRRRVEELEEQRASKDRIIGDLDEQTQVLERRLREAEARARRLAEENARLVEAADNPGPGGAVSPAGSPAAAKGSGGGGGGAEAEEDEFAAALEEAW